MSKIGVFVCHCGHNIAGTVDVQSVVEEVLHHPDVCFAVDYKYMCSDPGPTTDQRTASLEHNLDGVVVAACSPAMHETTFRRTVSGSGVNPYRCESANIREQVSWVHQKEISATSKAAAIARSIVEKVKGNEELEPLTMPVNQRVLVIGAGVAGLQAALDIAKAGYPVILAEREDSLGGNMARLSGSFINFAAAPGLLQEKIDQVEKHPLIQVLTSGLRSPRSPVMWATSKHGCS
jgi:heterodisulfide reductase subunit A2